MCATPRSRRSTRHEQIQRLVIEGMPEGKSPFLLEGLVPYELRSGRVSSAYEPDESSSRRGRHQGRHRRVLRRDRPCAHPAPAQPAVHAQALPGWDSRPAVLPQAGSEGEALLDPDAPVPDPAARRRAAARRLHARERAGGPGLDGADELHRLNAWYSRSTTGPDGLRRIRPRNARVAQRLRPSDSGRAPVHGVERSSAAPTEDERGRRNPSMAVVRIVISETYALDRAGLAVSAGTHGARPMEWLKPRRGSWSTPQNGHGKTIASVYSTGQAGARSRRRSVGGARRDGRPRDFGMRARSPGRAVRDCSNDVAAGNRSALPCV